MSQPGPDESRADDFFLERLELLRGEQDAAPNVTREIAERLRILASHVRIVEATPENAERLHTAYQAEFIDDEGIFSSVHSPALPRTARGLDGVTEPRIPVDFMSYLTMPCTKVLEVQDPNGPSESPPLGFMVVQHGGVTTEDHAAFQKYIEETRFPPHSKRFQYRRGREAEREVYESALRDGDLIFIPELVSGRHKESTLLLFHGMFSDIVHPVEANRGRPFRAVFGNGLEHAAIGNCATAFGNRRIHDLATYLSLFPIASFTQRRDLLLPANRVAEYIERYRKGDMQRTVRIPARLTFGLYFGDRERMEESLQSLDAYASVSSPHRSETASG